MSAASPFLHFAGAHPASTGVTIGVVFVALFVLSFALGKLPPGQHRLSRAWLKQWFEASIPRLAIAAIFTGLIFGAGALAGGDDGASGNDATAVAGACGRPLSALTGNPVTSERISAAAEGMRAVQAAAETPDPQGAKATFFGETHALTHDIDPPLRAVDPELARLLCESVVILEVELATQPDLARVAGAAAASATQLEGAGEALGLGQ